MEKYRFDSATHSMLDKLCVPFAVYQLVDKRVETILLSDGFCDLFGFEKKDEAYYVMEHDMWRSTHPEDKARVANEAYRFAIEGGKFEIVYRTLTRNRTDYMIVHAIGEHVYTDDGVRLAYLWYTDEGTYTTENDNERSSLTAAMEKNRARGEYDQGGVLRLSDRTAKYVVFL